MDIICASELIRILLLVEALQRITLLLISLGLNVLPPFNSLLIQVDFDIVDVLAHVLTRDLVSR